MKIFFFYQILWSFRNLIYKKDFYTFGHSRYSSLKGPFDLIFENSEHKIKWYSWKQILNFILIYTFNEKEWYIILFKDLLSDLNKVVEITIKVAVMIIMKEIIIKQ